MWADVLTKPLQGLAFKQMRAQLMNCSVEYEENEEQEMTTAPESLPKGRIDPLEAPQECVGNNAKIARTTDRRLGVARVIKRCKPHIHERGRE